MRQAAPRIKDTRGSRSCRGGASGRRNAIAMEPPGYGIALADGQTGEKAVPLTVVTAIQAKPKIGPPNDKYEAEADRVAQTVMRMPYAAAEPEEKLENRMVQTKPFADKIMPAPDGSFSQSSDKVRPFSISGNGNAASGNQTMERAAHAAIRNKGPGKPLEPAVRRRLERGTGTRLEHVRIHHDATAHFAARQLNARAFTHRSDVWLGRGESPADLQLMAHEATHVLQQSSAVRRLAAEPARESRSASRPASPEVPSRRIPSAAQSPTPPPAPVAVTPLPALSPPSPGPAAPATEALPAAEIHEPAAGATGTAPVVALLMPEPPDDLSDADRRRLAVVGENASNAAATQSDLPSAAENVSQARGAVTEPVAETAARAEGALVSALGSRPEPSPEIEALCQRILAIIHSRQPPDEASLVQSRPRQEAGEAGAALESAVSGDVQRVQGSYQQLNAPPAGAPRQQARPLETPAESVPSPDINAAQAVPDAVPAENVSLNADVEASANRMSEAGMDSAPAQLVQGGPIAEARAAQGELTATAARDPAEVLAQQQAARAQASADMAELQAQALAALQASRAGTVQGVGSRQSGMVASEEQLRTQAAERARTIFNNAQERVNALLEPLTATAMRRWETGVEILSGRFERDLAQVQSWLDERYSGVGGAILEFVEDIVGKPAWVTRAYDRAERNFADGVCNLIREISAEVNSVIATCEQIIDDANAEIAGVFANLPAGLQEWAAGEQARFAEQLEGLRTRVINTRDEFNAGLAERAAQSVQQVRERIHALRQAAGGLIGRIEDAVNRFLEDPAKFIIEGLLELVGIPPASFWAVVNRIQTVIQDIANDPLNFANNLVDALGQGFQRFFDNFAHHILGGFFDWLFSGLGAVGVEIPRDLSLKSIITFFLQLMGITWARIRQLLARHIGEENVALIERAYEIIANLIEMGPQGIFEMIKEQLNPRNLLDQVLRAAIDFLVETLIVRVTARIIAMFNPAGAIVQAIELIYRVLRWIFDNAARIFSLVETVVNGAAALIAGSIGGMATAIEGALARLIAPVIDFLAGFLGLGALPDRIADTIRGFQDWVMSILERVIRWLADRARALLARLGIGRSEEDGEEVSGVKAAARQDLIGRIQGSLKNYEEANNIISSVFRAHRNGGLQELDIELNSAGKFDIYAVASPKTLIIGDVEYEIDPEKEKQRMIDLSIYLNPQVSATFILVGINNRPYDENPIEMEKRKHADIVFLERHLPGIAEEARQNYNDTGEASAVSLTLNRNPCGECAPPIAAAQARHRQYIRFRVFFAGPWAQHSEFEDDKRTLSSDAHNRVVREIATMIESGVHVGATQVWEWFTENHFSWKVKKFYGPENQLKEELVGQLIAEARELAEKSEHVEEDKQKIDDIKAR